MISLAHAQFTPHQNRGGSETEYDMNALAKRFNAQTKTLLEEAGLSHQKVFVQKRMVSSYLPIIT